MAISASSATTDAGSQSITVRTSSSALGPRRAGPKRHSASVHAAIARWINPIRNEFVEFVGVVRAGQRPRELSHDVVFAFGDDSTGIVI